MKARLALLLLALATSLGAQTTPPFGIRTKTPTLKAFTNARIVVSPVRTIASGTLVIKDGYIVGVGEQVNIPPGATVVDLHGRTIYPGFIDPFTQYGLKADDNPPQRWNQRQLQYEGTRTGANAWNDAIHAERDWVRSFQPDDKSSEELLKQGITVAQSAKLDGIFRGRSFVTLVGSGLPNDLVLREYSSQFASFNKGSSNQEYPSSLMGSIALIRQTLLDADWYGKARAAYVQNPQQKMPEVNLAVAALGSQRGQPIVFETDDEMSLLRAWRISQEFKTPFVQVGSGHEYERIADIAATGQTIIVPVNYPKAPEVKTAEDELDVSLADLRHWERAAANAAVLEQAKVPFAFTTYRLKDNTKFLANIRKAIQYGLSEQTALAALTTIPAGICGLSNEVGTLEIGKLANFIITDTSIFADRARIYSVYSKGNAKEFIALDQVDFRGDYALKLNDKDYALNLKGTIDAVQGELTAGEKKAKLDNVQVRPNELSFTAKLDSLGTPGIARFTGQRDQSTLAGMVTLPDMTPVHWSAALTSAYAPEKDTTQKADKKPRVFVSTVTSPNRAFGFTTPPQMENVLIKNATIWTSEDQGILQNTDLLVQNGKFAKIGKDLTAPSGVRVIDGTGKHISAGIIDEHSHIAISGDVNEGSFSVTSEVRIGDVVNPEDINIYRALASGVTTIQLMHGSANPIGGQTQIIKTRWGENSEGLKFAGAPPTIKFALGENVKQSGWGERYSIRYPQSRLGVETIDKDAFQAAREYDTDWKTYNALSAKEKARTVPPRRDLTLEALSDVINSRMFIHCHSYVASEILMLMRLAEQYGFKIQNFTHVLEGYKVADELAAHGATASSAPDWWAYKFEVYEAIPQNMCIMNERGVITSINSDSPELGRRLPQEAAKSVMYCGMSQEDAIKMVTLNSAKQLKIDNRIGSIRVGKDADFVIWNTNPLSIYAKAQQTWIDGKKYFDIESDQAMRDANKKERAALVQKVLQTPATEFAGSSRDGYKMLDRVWDCEDVVDYWKELNAYRNAIH